MAGTDRTVEPVLGGPVIILVEPQMAENIGAAARAMLNFGLTELRLVAPRDGWPNDAASAMASRAYEVLDHAQAFETTAAATADLQIVFAATARRRDMAKPVLTPRQAAAELRAEIGRGVRAGLLFGAERAGLDNDDVARASAIVEVPANPAFASLNLAQAVLIVGYEWFLGGSPPTATRDDLEGSLPATAEEFDYFFNRLTEAIDNAGFLKPVEKRPSMLRNIRNVFSRARLSEQEVRTLHGIISALQRRE